MNNIERALKYFKSRKAMMLADQVQVYEDMAINALEQLLTNRWIPISERLPEIRRHESGEPIEFNIMLQGGTVATTGCINREGEWGWMDWNNFKFNAIGVDVIAWQPLPESYKEEANAECKG